ncbi:MAG TPA: class II SORL domain-containing protein [bacterium]|uniref:Putative superoxide reductase n=1 Tax=candidate division TA06 bacterium ADurb.Bin417 TaxID=1852828 RepID=A0A1V5M8M2_UNCT6|nr:MAG: putative superoxide reductase [candidate division TA06 bacterium ADurb.Bin417]HNQ35077.1 class II SORL domain-containing protein [bacterium]HNS48395.1 class II SORL domain-containing protein [bacterium]
MADGTLKCADDILCGINRPKDPANPSDLEKKHLPVIEAPAQAGKDQPFQVRVEVGKLLAHPNEPAHFIAWLELYSGETFLGRAEFTGGGSYPTAVFTVKLSHGHGALRARALCNLHGLWESERPIEIIS